MNRQSSAAVASWEIRDARIDDVTDMDRLLQQLADHLGEPEIYRGNPGILQSRGFGEHKLFHTKIACLDNDPVGICIYFPEFSTWRGESGVYVQDLYIAPSMRGAGLGPELIGAVRSHASSLWDARYVRLSVDRNNQQAIRFYQRFGFEVDQDNLILKLIDTST